jgi:hypothetical protein
LIFSCMKRKHCCSHKHYYCGFQCRFNFHTLFLIFSTGVALNSGSLSTLEPGISSVYLCRRACSATCSYTLDDRLQGELDDMNVNSFLGQNLDLIAYNFMVMFTCYSSTPLLHSRENRESKRRLVRFRKYQW